MRNLMKIGLMGGLLLAAGISGVQAAEVGSKLAGLERPNLDYKTADAGTYVLDSSHASVVWKVWHMGFSHFAGRFDKITGTATVKPDDLNKSGVVITVDSSSADTGVAKLDDELDGAEFFDATKFPAITFTSTKVELTGKTADGKQQGKVYGMLSLRGVTKPVVLDAVFNGHGPNPMNQQERMGFNATLTIKRSDFGMDHLVPLVSDDVELEIAAEFSKAS